MIRNKLISAIQDIDDLNELTNQDISFARESKHQQLFDNKPHKEKLIKSFYEKKAGIDKELSSQISAGTKSIDDLLSKEDSELLTQLTTKLENLKKNNTQLARMVLALGEFYTSLKDKMLPSEKLGYDKRATANSRTANSILHIEA